MNIRNTIALCALAAMLGACAVSSTNAVTKPGEAKTGMFGLKTQDAVIADGESVYKTDKVVIGSFKVAFVEMKKASAKAGVGMGGKASASMKLNGLTPEIMQQVTEAAYADFTAKLKAAGYIIVDAPVFANADHEASPKVETASGFLSGMDSSITYVAPASIGQIYFAAGEGGKMGSLGSSNPTRAAVAYGEANKIPVLMVTYTVDFANAGGTVSHYALTSNMEVGQGIHVTSGSGIWLLEGQEGSFSHPNGSVKLGQAVSSPDEFGTVVNTNTQAGIVAETALNVFTSVLGGGSNQSRDFEINADPVKYQNGAVSVLAQTNSALIDKMKSLK